MIIILSEWALLKPFNRKSGVAIFRREHNIVNFRNAKWKILILSFLFAGNQTLACIHSTRQILIIRNEEPESDSSGML
jgi:hypothetical protein